MRPKALLAWSSGKGSAWALHRVAMHAVRTELLRAQAAAAGLPLRTVPLPSPCANDQYEAAMERALTEARDEGITAVAFGDLVHALAPGSG